MLPEEEEMPLLLPELPAGGANDGVGEPLSVAAEERKTIENPGQTWGGLQLTH